MKAYWTEKAELMIEDYNPREYRRLKKAKELKATVERLAVTALERYNQVFAILQKRNTPEVQFETQNPTKAQKETASWNNHVTAIEETEQTIKWIIS